MMEYSRNNASIAKRDSFYNGTEINSFKFLNRNIYLCAGYSGFRLFKFENYKLSLIDTLYTNNETYSSAIDKARLYVSDPGTGLWVFNVDYEPDEIVLPEVGNTRVQCDILMLSGNLQKIKLKNFDEGDYTIEIKDICGKTIKKESADVDNASFEKEIRLNDVVSGIYFLVVKNEKTFISKKILRF